MGVAVCKASVLNWQGDIGRWRFVCQIWAHLQFYALLHRRSFCITYKRPNELAELIMNTLVGGMLASKWPHVGQHIYTHIWTATVLSLNNWMGLLNKDIFRMETISHTFHNMRSVIKGFHLQKLTKTFKKVTYMNGLELKWNPLWGKA